MSVLRRWAKVVWGSLSLAVCSIESRCGLHKLVQILGWGDCGLLVAVCVKMSTRTVIQCDSKYVRLAFHLCTSSAYSLLGWCTCRLRGIQSPASKRSEEPMRSLPREEACKRARWRCMRCTVGLEFLTLGASVDVKPACCLALLHGRHSEDGGEQGFSERKWLLVERKLWSARGVEKGLSPGPEALLSDWEIVESCAPSSCRASSV